MPVNHSKVGVALVPVNHSKGEDWPLCLSVPIKEEWCLVPVNHSKGGVISVPVGPNEAGLASVPVSHSKRGVASVSQSEKVWLLSVLRRCSPCLSVLLKEVWPLYL